MGNTLKMDKQEVLKRIFGLGWSNRKINRATGINRRTLSKYRKTYAIKRTSSQSDDDRHTDGEQRFISAPLISQNAPLIGDSKCPPGQVAHFEVPTTGAFSSTR